MLEFVRCSAGLEAPDPKFDSAVQTADVAADLFTAETPMGTYQGVAEVMLSRTPAAFRTVLVPRGSSKPEWLTN